MAEIAPVPSVPDPVVPVLVVSVVPVVIFYDLETTDFNQRNCHRDVQIVSIGAVNGNTGDEYHKVSLFFNTCEQNDYTFSLTVHGTHCRYKSVCFKS